MKVFDPQVFGVVIWPDIVEKPTEYPPSRHGHPDLERRVRIALQASAVSGALSCLALLAWIF